MAYITKEKYINYVNSLSSFNFNEDTKNNLIKLFENNFEYDPNKSTYSPENYYKTREKNLKNSNGVTTRSPSQKKANDKYNERYREERNRKARERYHRLKAERDRTPTRIREEEIYLKTP